MSVKVDFTCLICSKILKSPFSLPCGDTICEEHLKETEVLKNNSIKCKSCEEVFEVKDNEMIRSNTTVQKLIQNERFLSDTEKSKKKSLEDSIENLFQLNEQLQVSKNIFDLDCYNHFQEIRRKIDVQREELKDQIDKHSLTMIDELKAIEEIYAKRIKEFQVETYDLEQEKNILNETFRDVNLLISSINQLQDKLDDDVLRLKSNLSEISQLKTFLIESNDFKPNLSFNRDSFGLLSSKTSSTFVFDKNQLTFLLSYNSHPKIATEHIPLNV
jgi:Fe-S cluster biosynthesis and repair protein YggX